MYIKTYSIFLENNNNKIYYHGVGNKGKFKEFRKDLIGSTSGNHGHYGMGFYFTPYERNAKSFSEFYGGTGEVIKAHLKMDNPFYVNEENLIKIGEKYDLNLPNKVDMAIDINDLLKKLKNIDITAYNLLKSIHKHKDYSKGWEEFMKNNKIDDSKLDLNMVSDWYEDTISERYGRGINDYTLEEMENIGIEPKIIRDYDEDIRMDYLTNLGVDSIDWTNAIKREGYDSIDANDEVVVFEPSQIEIIE